MSFAPGILTLIQSCKDRAAGRANQDADDQGRHSEQQQNKPRKHAAIMRIILQVVGLLFQFVGIVLACVFVGLDVMETTPLLTLIVLILGTAALSILWTNILQQQLTSANPVANPKKHDPNARWQASKL